MGVWNGPVNEHVAADLFVRTILGKANAFHLEFTAVPQPANFKVEPLVSEMLFLNCNLRINCIFATALQTLI